MLYYALLLALGINLHDLINLYGSGINFPPAHYLTIMRDVLSALDYLHTQESCLHDDIKGNEAICKAKTNDMFNPV